MKRQELIEQLFSSTQAMQKAWKASFYAILGQVQLTPSQLALIFLIKEEQPINGRDLAVKMHISPSAVTQLLDSLDHAGYIQRDEDQADRRVSYIKLSELGASKVKQLEKRRKDYFISLAEALSDQELESMIKIQAKMTPKINKPER